MGQIVTGDMQLVRQVNRTAVLQLVREHGPLSRVALARLARLTTATAFSIVQELLELGLVRQSGVGASVGGRKPMLFEFNPGAFVALGVDLRSDRLIAVAADLAAHPLANIVHPYQGKIDGLQAAHLIAEAARSVMSRSEVTAAKTVGLGVSVPALIDAEGSLVVRAVNLGWEDVPLRSLLQEQLDVPVHVIDRSAALALAETHWGAGRAVRNLVCINVGTGVGSGIVVDGHLYRGVDGAAGEIGHTTVDHDGPQCRCGNYGCLERLVASPAIVERAVKGLKQSAVSSMRDRVEGRLEDVTLQVVVEAARAGDDFARHILAETGRYLGIGIANMVNLLNPELVIVGGGVTEAAGELILEPARQAVNLRALDVHARRVRIVPVDLGIEAPAIGAATWAMIRAGLLAAEPLTTARLGA
jgi:glucokinase-like ROK family protein